MARTKQQLINYHTGSKTTAPAVADVEYGEIVVRHNIEAPQLLIKVDSAGTPVFVPFIASGQISTAIAAVTETIDGNIADVDAKVDAVSATVNSNYWTSAETKSYADAVSAAAKTGMDAIVGTTADTSSTDSVVGAKKYADEKVATLSGNILSYIDSIDEAFDDQIEALSGHIVTVSGAVKTLSGDVVSYVDNKLTTVYKYKGTKATCADLPAEASQGDVWNVIAASGSTPAGTNYAWTGSEWDPLGGSIDTSDFATKSGDIADLVARFEEDEEDIAEADAKAEYVSGAVTTFSAAVESNYATKTYAESEADAAELAAKIASSAYTDAQITALSGAVISANESLVEDISKLQGSGATWNEKTGTALYSAALGTATNDNQTTQSGAKMSYTAGNGAILDLSELKIDCGEF